MAARTLTGFDGKLLWASGDEISRGCRILPPPTRSELPERKAALEARRKEAFAERNAGKTVGDPTVLVG